jgi:hypothetical protein
MPAPILLAAHDWLWPNRAPEQLMTLVTQVTPKTLRHPGANRRIFKPFSEFNDGNDGNDANLDTFRALSASCPTRVLVFTLAYPHTHMLAMTDL